MQKRLCLKLFFICFSLAQPSFAEIHQIPDVIVSTTRSEQSDIRLPIPQAVITAKDIDESGATHITQLLKHRAGIQIRDTFGDGSGAVVSMRGFGGNAAANALVLVDGRRLNESDLSAPDLNTIDLKNVERIEIIPGSAAVLYGDQAVGGVINIITKPIEAFATSIEAGVGSHSDRTAAASFQNHHDGGYYYRLSANTRHGDNYRDQNAIRLQRLNLQSGFDYFSGSFNLNYLLIEEDLRLPGALSNLDVKQDRRQTRFPHDFIDTDTHIIHGLWQQFIAKDWVLALDATAKLSDANGRFSTTQLQQDREVFSINPRLIGEWQRSQGSVLLTVGSDIEFTDYALEAKSAFFSMHSDTERLTVSGYSQLLFPITEKFQSTLGIRYQLVNDDIKDNKKIHFDDDVWVTELGLNYEATKYWQLFLRRADNFRFAKVDEQTFTAVNNQNKHSVLDTQTGTSYELGSHWFNKHHQLDVLIYWLDIDNEIDFDPAAINNFGGKGANNNLDPTRRLGLQLDHYWQLHPWFRLQTHYHWLKARYHKGIFKNNIVPFTSEHTLSGSLHFEPRPWVTSWVEIQTQSERYAIGDHFNAERALGGFTLFNAAVQLKHKQWALNLRGNNLSNKRYNDFVSLVGNQLAFFPAPERTFYVTLSYALD